MKHTLSVLVRNHSGVLSHVAGLFTRRAYNIESLVAGVTENPAVSRITIVVKGDEHVLEQVIKQLRKLVDVIKVQDLRKSLSVESELALITVKATSATRSEILHVTNALGASVLHLGKDTITIQVASKEHIVNNLVEVMSQFGIVDVTRTGVLALPVR